MINIIVLLISAGCAAAAFYKGTIVRAFAAIIAAVCALVVAFNYFEFLKPLIGFTGSWSTSASFLLLGVLVFGILMAAVVYLTRNPVDFGFLPERIGRVVLGLILGLILSGFLLIFLAMAPLSAKLPYSRFEQANQASPNKLLLNADGFVTGMFSTLSSGSFSGKKSFASQHPKFLDQLYLDRFNKTAGNQRTDGASMNQQDRGGSGQGARQGGGGSGQQQGGRQGRSGTGRGGRQGRGSNSGQPGDSQQPGRGFPGQEGDSPQGSPMPPLSENP